MGSQIPIPSPIIKWLVRKANEKYPGSNLSVKNFSGRYNQSSRGPEQDTVLFSSKEKANLVVLANLLNDEYEIGSSTKPGEPKSVFKEKDKYRLNFSNVKQFGELVNRIEAEEGFAFQHKPWEASGYSVLNQTGRASNLSGASSAFDGTTPAFGLSTSFFTDVPPQGTPVPQPQRPQPARSAGAPPAAPRFGDDAEAAVVVQPGANAQPTERDPLVPRRDPDPVVDAEEGGACCPCFG